MSLAQATTLSPDEFSALMDVCGPFEPAPRLAVGVSGGADSLALTLLLSGWAKARGGSLTALTVDHGLRPGSAEEAAETGRMLARHGVTHTVLRWRGSRPDSGIQAAARAARLGLLAEWCQSEGVLHLVLAHHAGDQAETLVQRLCAGSGLEGLAAMAPVRELSHCRLLRPLIPVAPKRLRATLHAVGQDWIEDPSNDDTRFGRVQARRLLSRRRAPERTRSVACATAEALGRWRTVLEVGCAELAAKACRLHPEGYAELDGDALRAAPQPLAERLLRQLFRAIGGAAYGISALDAATAYRWLAEGPEEGAVNLGRCQLLAGSGEAGRLLLCRERRDLPELICKGAGPWSWDGRFLLRRSLAADRTPFRVFPWHAAAGRGALPPHPPGASSRIPIDVWVTLPWFEVQGGGPARVALNRASRSSAASGKGLLARYHPAEPLVSGPFYGCLGRGGDTI